jgi:hypothetical protein
MVLNTLEQWSNLLQTAGVLAATALAAVGLVLVIIELRSMRKSINHSSSSQVYTYMLDLLRIQIEHPELRRFIYGGQSPPKNRIEADRVSAFFGAFGDFMEFVFAQRRLGVLPESEFHGTWQPFFTKLLSQSPGLNAYVDNPDYYSLELRRFAQLLKPKVTPEKP